MTQGQFMFESVWFVLMGFFVYYLLVIKPGVQKADAQKKFIAELKKNDEVLTGGGVFGRVIQSKPDCITLEIAQNVRVRVHPDHIRRIATPATVQEGQAQESTVTAKRAP